LITVFFSTLFFEIQLKNIKPTCGAEPTKKNELFRTVKNEGVTQKAL
jgi:hypothetical protein